MANKSLRPSNWTKGQGFKQDFPVSKEPPSKPANAGAGRPRTPMYDNCGLHYEPPKKIVVEPGDVLPGDSCGYKPNG